MLNFAIFEELSVCFVNVCNVKRCAIQKREVYKRFKCYVAMEMEGEGVENFILKIVFYFTYFFCGQGQNDFSIKVITQELNYLTWEEAFTCLSDERLPDKLRSQYCDLIISE